MIRAPLSHSALRQRVVLLCAVLAAALALLWLTPASLATWRRWQEPAPQPPALGEFERAALAPRVNAGVQEEMLQRPLFMPSRRPQPKEVVEETAPPAPVQRIEQVQLRGMVDAQGVSGVLVELDGITYFVHTGEALPGTEWRLAALQGRTARFESGTSSYKLELPFLENLGAPPGVASGRRR